MKRYLVYLYVMVGLSGGIDDIPIRLVGLVRFYNGRRTTFLDAVKKGDICLVEEFIGRGKEMGCTIDWNRERNEANEPVLYIAARSNRYQVVRCLLRHGADAEVRISENTTCKEWAQASRNYPLKQAFGLVDRQSRPSSKSRGWFGF